MRRHWSRELLTLCCAFTLALGGAPVVAGASGASKQAMASSRASTGPVPCAVGSELCPCLAASTASEGPSVPVSRCCSLVASSRGAVVPDCLCPLTAGKPTQAKMALPICCYPLQSTGAEGLCPCMAHPVGAAGGATTRVVSPCCYPPAPEGGSSVPSCVCGPVASAAGLACTLRPMPRRFYGVNFDFAGFAPFAQTNVGPLLAALQPTTLR
jgi:hypothetical protein